MYCRSTPIEVLQYFYWSTPVLLIGLLQYLHWITPVLLLDYSSTCFRIHKSTVSCFPAKPISSSTCLSISSSTRISSTRDNIFNQLVYFLIMWRWVFFFRNKDKNVFRWTILVLFLVWRLLTLYGRFILSIWQYVTDGVWQNVVCDALAHFS